MNNPKSLIQVVVEHRLSNTGQASEHSIYDQVMTRLQGWSSEPERSLLHTLYNNCDTRRHLTTTRMQADLQAAPFAMSSKGEYMAMGAATGIKRRHLMKHFRDSDKWWDTITIHAILELVAQVTRQRRPEVSGPAEPLWWQNRFRFRSLSTAFSSMSSSKTDDPTGKNWPLPSLGRNTKWRKQNTVSVVTPGSAAHFVTVVILARLKLVLIFDGLAGSCDSRSIWTVSLSASRSTFVDIYLSEF